MVISADFEKQKQYFVKKKVAFVKKIIALSQYCSSKSLVKIARLTRALRM
jgi:hypothetical protein